MDADLRLRVEALIAEASYALDNEDYQAWLDLFHDDCAYRIVPLENIQQGLPGSVMLCETKKALSDRIVSLLRANTFNPHSARHITGPPRIRRPDRGPATRSTRPRGSPHHRPAADYRPMRGDRIEAETSYALYQTDVEGVSRLFATGCYRDTIGAFGGALKFTDRTVVLDSFAIPTLLAKPV